MDDFERFLDEQLEDPEFRQEWEKLEAERKFHSNGNLKIRNRLKWRKAQTMSIVRRRVDKVALHW